MQWEITDQSGNHRLTVRYEPQKGGGADFHSLVWSVRAGEVWCDKVVISRADFQSGAPHRRWVAELHSFSPETARAIIKVAEGDAPERNPGGVRYHYSWREWDVQNNRELRSLCDCPNPFDKYAPSV